MDGFTLKPGTGAALLFGALVACVLAASLGGCARRSAPVVRAEPISVSMIVENVFTPSEPSGMTEAEAVRRALRGAGAMEIEDYPTGSAVRLADGRAQSHAYNFTAPDFRTLERAHNAVLGLRGSEFHRRVFDPATARFTLAYSRPMADSAFLSELSGTASRGSAVFIYDHNDPDPKRVDVGARGEWSVRLSPRTGYQYFYGFIEDASGRRTGFFRHRIDSNTREELTAEAFHRLRLTQQ